MRLSPPTKLPIALLLAATLLVLLPAACEHGRYWRGSEPHNSVFTKRMSDPHQAQLELERIMAPPALPGQTAEQAANKSVGCISCHGTLDEPDMHVGRKLTIGCTDCHGGDASVISPLAQPGRPDKTHDTYWQAMFTAHVQPRNPQTWYGKDHLTDGRALGEHTHSDPTELHGSANPQNTYAALNHESPQFIRFINPGDLRIADFACGSCHSEQVANVRHSMMAHGSMLWTAALYNNGAIPNKQPRYGESYSAFGIPQRLWGVIEKAKWDKQTSRLITQVRPPTKHEVLQKGVLPYLDPLPTWNVSQPSNILRVFERGTKLPVPGGPTPNASPLELADPNALVLPGRPDKELSPRGLGTLNRTDPVFIGLQKTRLHDPILYFMGTNDHPGDYRSSGCTSCHTIYANDRDPLHAAQYATSGNTGRSFSSDPTLPKDEPGHPIKHVFTKAISNSQCIVCHVHPGTSYANTYLGYMWWDNESDGEHLYPANAQHPTDAQQWRALRKNPDSAQIKGLWGNLFPQARSHAGDKAGENFLENTGSDQFNAKLKHNQFADFHGHGWMFRGVYKKDRRGNLLTSDGQIIDPDDSEKWSQAVHLKDVHLVNGMQCVDCHFSRDVHGTGKLYGEARNAVEITCIDCHGTYERTTTMRTSGPAAPPDGTDMSKMRVSPRKKRFFKKEGRLYQRSSLDPDVQWEVPQTVDTINPLSEWFKRNPEAGARSRYAKTIRTDGKIWGDLPVATAGDSPLAHNMDNMECYTCHTSWMTSCFGCHLPMQANDRSPMLHNENLYTRNYTRYHFQVLRDDVFMLGRDGSVRSGSVDAAGRATAGKIVPVRSSSAVIVSSQNANREWIYHQQQTISSEGYSGQAFNPHFPHATSGRGTTKTCTDCHLSPTGDNNAWLAQLLTQGTNFVNFFGRYIYVATGKGGFEAVAVTEHDEPQAVYGSHLHKLAYPDRYEQFQKQDHRLHEAYGHGPGLAQGGARILDLQLRGEYVYAACGPGGLYVYDVANIDNKGFSQRIVTAPVSPLGQHLGVDTKYAVAIASPTTLGVDPARMRLSNDMTKPPTVMMQPAESWHINQEQRIHPMYAFLYIGDREEGLIMTNATTLLDGDPGNNFLVRTVLADGSTAFNPDGLLDGLTHLVLAGRYLYVTAQAGLIVIDIDNPLDPKVVSAVGSDVLVDPVSVAIQLRYAFVTDRQGLKVMDVTDPTDVRPVAGAVVPLQHAQRIYVARTYAFIADGPKGLAIIDVTQPQRPRLMQHYTAGGQLNDVRDVKVGMTNASLYAYVADGASGLRVLQLMGPNTTPQFRGFAPPLKPQLIATYRTRSPALAISKGLDRDRAVDESGNQLVVFARWGARPLNLTEQQRLYLRNGKPFTVTDEPQTQPRDFLQQQSPPPAPKSRKRPGARH